MSMTELYNKVNEWAKINASEDFYYGSPQSYWIKALNNNIITQDEYLAGEKYYAKLWCYRGD